MRWPPPIFRRESLARRSRIFSALLALNPRHFGAMAGFGMILEELDRKDQALEVYRQALAIHPHLAGVMDSVKRLEEEAAGQEL